MEKKTYDVKIPVLKKIGYGFGEAGSQFSFTLVSSYLTVYYTDVVGLTPLIISAIMLIARIWDAVNDPIFGSIAENTHSRWGRFRPYILFGAPVLALFNCLTFLNLDIAHTWKTIWCTITYIGCGMAYTAVNISVGSMANSLTSNNTERVSLNAYRGVIGSLAGLLINAITMPLILYFGSGDTSNGTGYFMAAIIFSLLAVPCLVICGVSTKEVIGGGVRKAGNKESVVKNLIASFKLTLKNRDAALVMVAMLLFLTGVFGRIGIMAYYFIYVLKDAAIVSICAAALTLGSIMPNFYIPSLMKRINKKTCGAISCVLQAVCCTAFFFAGQQGSVALIIIISFIYGATNFGALVAYGLGAEIIDANWIKTGVRTDGVIYAVFSFAVKMGNAVGGSIGILALGAVGFIANTEMSAEVLGSMNAVINFGPAAVYLLAAIPFMMIGMTNKTGRENEMRINEGM